MNGGTNVIDAALRFARSNPEVLACAREGASRTGCSVDELLTEAVARMHAAVAQRGLEQRERRSAGGARDRGHLTRISG